MKIKLLMILSLIVQLVILTGCESQAYSDEPVKVTRDTDIIEHNSVVVLHSRHYGVPCYVTGIGGIDCNWSRARLADYIIRDGNKEEPIPAFGDVIIQTNMKQIIVSKTYVYGRWCIQTNYGGISCDWGNGGAL